MAGAPINGGELAGGALSIEATTPNYYPCIDPQVLAAALRKVNRLDARAEEFSNDELLSLWALHQRQIGLRTEPPNWPAFARRLELFLREAPVPTIPPTPQERRSHFALRLALDRLRKGLALTGAESVLVSDTFSELKGLSAPAPNQARLVSLIQDFASGTALAPDLFTPGETAEEPAAESVTVLEALSGGERTIVTELLGLAVKLTVRVFEIEGSVEVRCEVPEDVLLRASGSVHVAGAVQGHVTAQRDIVINGHAMGGVIVSASGDITAGRVLSGARLVAFGGNILVDAVENAELLLAQGVLRIKTNLRAQRILAGQSVIGGSVSDTSCHIVSSLDAAVFSSGGRARGNIVFRQFFTGADWGLPLDDEQANVLRSTLRARLRERIAEDWLQLARREQSAVQLVLLHGTHTSDLAPAELQSIRSVYASANYLRAILLQSHRLIQGLLEAAESPEHWVRTAGAAVTDECLSNEKLIEKDVEQLGEEQVGSARADLLTECRHLTSITKKCKEALVGKKSLTPAFEALRARSLEWEARLERAETECNEYLVRLRRSMELPAATRVEDLLVHTETSMIHRLPGPFARGLQGILERAPEKMGRWQTAREQATAEAHAGQERLRSEHLASFPPDNRLLQSATSGAWSQNVQVSPAAVSAESVLPSGAAIVLEQAIESRTTLRREAFSIVRETA